MKLYPRSQEYSDIVWHYFCQALQTSHSLPLVPSSDSYYFISVSSSASLHSRLQLWLRIVPNVSIPIQQVVYRVHGCPVTIAIAVWLSKYLPKVTLTELQQFENILLQQQLEIREIKLHCVFMAEDAIHHICQYLKGSL